MSNLIDRENLIAELKKYSKRLERHSGESYSSVVKSCISIVEEQPLAKAEEYHSDFFSLNDEMINRSMREKYSENDRQFGY